jgi:hypothetical protein
MLPQSEARIVLESQYRSLNYGKMITIIHMMSFDQ